jgi:hypothetical protein
MIEWTLQTSSVVPPSKPPKDNPPIHRFQQNSNKEASEAPRRREPCASAALGLPRASRCFPNDLGWLPGASGSLSDETEHQPSCTLVDNRSKRDFTDGSSGCFCGGSGGEPSKIKRWVWGGGSPPPGGPPRKGGWSGGGGSPKRAPEQV